MPPDMFDKIMEMAEGSHDVALEALQEALERLSISNRKAIYDYLTIETVETCTIYKDPHKDVGTESSVTDSIDVERKIVE